MENRNQKKGIDLFVFLQGIWEKRFFIIKSIVVGFVLGVLIAYSIPKLFQAEVKFAIDGKLSCSKEQGISIATLMGLNIKDIYKTEVPIDMYPEFAMSTRVLSELASLRIRASEGGEIMLLDYAINFQKESWWNKILKLPKTVKSWFVHSGKGGERDTVWDCNHLTLNQQCYLDYLRKNVQVEMNEKSAIGFVRVKAQNAIVAAEIANAITEKLEKRVAEVECEKLDRELLLAQKMYENAENEYRTMLERYESGVSRSKVASYSPVQLDIAFNLYNMIAQQYEIMKVNAGGSSVSFDILQPAVASDIPIAPHKGKIIIGFMFVFGFVAVFCSLFKQAWEMDYKNNE